MSLEEWRYYLRNRDLSMTNAPASKFRRRCPFKFRLLLSTSFYCHPLAEDDRVYLVRVMLSTLCIDNCLQRSCWWRVITNINYGIEKSSSRQSQFTKDQNAVMRVVLTINLVQYVHEYDMSYRLVPSEALSMAACSIDPAAYQVFYPLICISQQARGK